MAVWAPERRLFVRLGGVGSARPTGPTGGEIGSLIAPDRGLGCRSDRLADRFASPQLKG